MIVKCEHGRITWKCHECTDEKLLATKKLEAKVFIDANVWDGEDRRGAKNDRATFNPDDLQELINDLIEELYQ